MTYAMKPWFQSDAPSEMLTVDTVYSADDHGWYSEVWDEHGKNVYTSEVMRSRQAAKAAGVKWAGRQPGSWRHNQPGRRGLTGHDEER